MVGGTWKSLLIDTMVHRHKIFEENKILWYKDCDITNNSNDSWHSLYLTPNKKLSRTTQGINPPEISGAGEFWSDIFSKGWAFWSFRGYLTCRGACIS